MPHITPDPIPRIPLLIAFRGRRTRLTNPNSFSIGSEFLLRPPWRSISDRAHTSHPMQRFEPLLQYPLLSSTVKSRRIFMHPSVMANLVSRVAYLLDQVRKSVGHVARNEKGGLDLLFRKQIENSRRTDDRKFSSPQNTRVVAFHRSDPC
jgi:hypothetical protein